MSSWFIQNQKNSDLTFIRRLGLLFTTFFKISLFVVGGGLAMLPVVEEKFVRETKLLKPGDILDMTVLAQAVPGVIAVNTALFVGTKIAGFLGALVALIGVMMPSLGIIIGIAAFFPELNVQNPSAIDAFSCVRAAIAGVLSVTAVRLFKSVAKNKIDYLITGVFFLALMAGMNPAYVILSSIPVGYLYIFIRQRLILRSPKND